MMTSTPFFTSPDLGKLDRYWMQRCLVLARQAGRTSPNPKVGSVVVSGSQRVGEGFHPGAGHPHAEVFALRQAGSAARGATLYVNLEPCNHYGRTPPCTEAILLSGISRVVVGIPDANPLVAGQGIARLEAAGVEVTVGVEDEACQCLNEAFFFAIQHQRCFGLLKYAMTLDGKIATVTGASQWISGAAARERVHQWRAEMDAVVVGSGTVWRDNPQLTSRLSQGGIRQPLRVVLSRGLDLPRQAHLWHTEVAPTLVLTSSPPAPSASRDSLQAYLQTQGVEVIALPDLTPLAAARLLYQKGCLSALWECGGTLAAAAVESGSIQKVAAFVAPKLIGGSQAPGPLGGAGIPGLDAAVPIVNGSIQAVGEDWLIEGYLASNP